MESVRDLPRPPFVAVGSTGQYMDQHNAPTALAEGDAAIIHGAVIEMIIRGKSLELHLVGASTQISRHPVGHRDSGDNMHLR